MSIYFPSKVGVRAHVQGRNFFGSDAHNKQLPKHLSLIHI